MKFTRRFAVASLLVIAVAVVLGAPASANGGMNQVKLRPPADGPFPNASGQVSLYVEKGSIYYGAQNVSVSKLAPNTSYFMPVYIRWFNGYVWYMSPSIYSFQTDARGGYKSGMGGYYVFLGQVEV
jgi:hypothetical protein